MMPNKEGRLIRGLERTKRHRKRREEREDGVVEASATPISVRAGGRFVADFMEEDGRVSIAHVADRLGLSKSQPAETVGLKPEALHRTSRLEARKTRARTTEMLEIVGRLVDWAGGEKQALAWYRAEPLPAFGDRTAEALVKEGCAAVVRDYLDRVATGGFA